MVELKIIHFGRVFYSQYRKITSFPPQDLAVGNIYYLFCVFKLKPGFVKMFLTVCSVSVSWQQPVSFALQQIGTKKHVMVYVIKPRVQNPALCGVFSTSYSVDIVCKPTNTCCILAFPSFALKACTTQDEVILFFYHLFLILVTLKCQAAILENPFFFFCYVALNFDTYGFLVFF